MQISSLIQIISEKDFIEKSNPILNGYSKILILTDTNVAEHCLPILLNLIPQLSTAEVIEVDPGEESKSLEVSNHIWQHLAELNADRNTLIINLGGGMITDLGAWIASTYKRGIPFIHIPTTVLAMADAAIGGKSGINHSGFKNNIGTFAKPKFTLLYSPFLRTLSPEEKISGFAEIIKTGLIADQEVWNLVKEIDPEEIDDQSEVIFTIANIKYEITENDFKEIGIRKTLNFGHTIGHALESYFLDHSSPISHGFAVGLGMICETALSTEVNNLDAKISQDIIEHLKWIYDPQTFALPKFEEIKRYLLQDKKNENNQIQFVLLDSPGKASFNHPISLEVIERQYRKSLFASNV